MNNVLISMLNMFLSILKIRDLWQLKTLISLHRCQKCSVPLVKMLQFFIVKVITIEFCLIMLNFVHYFGITFNSGSFWIVFLSFNNLKNMKITLFLINRLVLLKLWLTDKGISCFKTYKQLFEYPHLLLCRDIWWSKF